MCSLHTAVVNGAVSYEKHHSIVVFHGGVIIGGPGTSLTSMWGEGGVFSCIAVSLDSTDSSRTTAAE